MTVADFETPVSGKYFVRCLDQMDDVTYPPGYECLTLEQYERYKAKMHSQECPLCELFGPPTGKHHAQ